MPLTGVLIDGFLGGFVSELGGKLGSTCGMYTVNELAPTTSAPGLVESVKQDPRYIEHLETCAKALSQANTLQKDTRDIQKQFSQDLLVLLSELKESLIENQLNQLQAQWDIKYWPSKVSPEDTKTILGKKKHQLLVLTAPPDISDSCSDSLRHNLQNDVRNGVTAFLDKHYSSDSPVCPTTSYVDYFKEPVFRLDIEKLRQRILGEVPTVVIYSQLTDYEATFHVSCWNPASGEPIHYSIPVWKWKNTYDILKQKRCKEEDAYKQIREVVVCMHQLLAGFLTDWYYLSINIFYEPQLLSNLEIPQLDKSSAGIFEPYIETLRKTQVLQRISYLKERKLLNYRSDTSSSDRSEQIVKSTYASKLKYEITRNYPLTEKTTGELKLVQSLLKLSDQQKDLIYQPVIKQKEEARIREKKADEKARKQREKQFRIRRAQEQRPWWILFLVRSTAFITGGVGVLWSLLFLLTAFGDPTDQGTLSVIYLIFITPGLFTLWASNRVLKRFPKNN